MTLNDRIFYNEREQVVSSDWNRDAQLTGRTLGGALQALLGAMPYSFWNHPGAAALQSAPFTGVAGVGAYLAADVLGGLMVNVNNSAYLLVGAGALGVADPAADSFDSSYGIVVDPGVTTTDVLTFTANASGQVRWDLVECRPVDTVISTESRNVLNEGTGAWVPTLIPKRKAGRLQYRIRTGTPGSGVPSPDPLWCPLAAIHVNSGASGFTQCDAYDLRPLVSDRCPMPERRLVDSTWTPDCRPVDGQAWSLYGSADTFHGGIVAHGFGYWAGGLFKRSTPTSLADFGVATTDFVASNIANQTLGLVTSGDAVYSVVAHFPQGFPRWVRYQQVAGSVGRIPAGPRGILWLQAGHAAGANGVVVFGGTPPAVAGLGAVPCPGVLISYTHTASGGWYPFHQSGPVWQAAISGDVAFTIAGSGGEATLLRGTNIPPQAREVMVLVRATFTGIASGHEWDSAKFTASAGVGANLSPGRNNYAYPVLTVPDVPCHFDLVGPEPGSTVAAADPKILVTYQTAAAATATLSACSMVPQGWKL